MFAYTVAVIVGSIFIGMGCGAIGTRDAPHNVQAWKSGGILVALGSAIVLLALAFLRP
jgi:hypothetical protein